MSRGGSEFENLKSESLFSETVRMTVLITPLRTEHSPNETAHSESSLNGCWIRGVRTGPDWNPSGRLSELTRVLAAIFQIHLRAEYLNSGYSKGAPARATLCHRGDTE